MKFLQCAAWLLTVSSTVSASAIEQRAACNADNCLRAVRSVGIRGTADCSSFLATSVKSVTATTTTTTNLPTTTVTYTRYSVVGGTVLPTPQNRRRDDSVLEIRAAPVHTIPSYAISGCSNDPSRYSSACSCVVTATATTTFTSTVATTTSTSTKPAVTASTTTTIAVCDPADNYGLRYQGGSYQPPPGSSTDMYDIASATTAKDCCVACFSTKGCSFFEFFSRCTLTESLNGNVTDPYNPTCPYGDTLIDFQPGTVYAWGPCAAQGHFGA